MKPWLIPVLLSAVALLSACSNEKMEVLKSPCVGLEGSPCGPKRPVNGLLNPGAVVMPEHS